MTVDPQTLSLVLYPEAVLKETAKTVDPRDENVHAVAKAMIQIMRDHRGVGLAAPQVGLSWRLFVTHDPDDPENAIAWINPILEVLGDEVAIEEEGCLSIPDIRGMVPRRDEIRVRSLDRDGREHTMTASGFPARVIQHETDHLDGVLFLDRMTSLETLTYLSEFERHSDVSNGVNDS